MTNVDVDLMLHDLLNNHDCAIVSFRHNTNQVELKVFSRPLNETFTASHYSFSKALQRLANQVSDREYKKSELASSH
jgi:hypothetical protein